MGYPKYPKFLEINICIRIQKINFQISDNQKFEHPLVQGVEQKIDIEIFESYV